MTERGDGGKGTEPCATCLGSGKAWASAAAMPRGFKLFAGSAVKRSPDHSEMLLVCWHCDGSGKARKAQSNTGKDG